MSDDFMQQAAAIWRLSKQGERRLAEGHPWVFANELAHKPGALVPGSLVRLESLDGRPLCLGYGNPHSLIVFRKLQERASTLPLNTEELIARRLYRAARKRAAIWGDLNRHSFRLCYGEADDLPGLIIDIYAATDHPGAKIWVIQLLTAGMERLFGQSTPIMQGFYAEASSDPELKSAFCAEQSCVILRRDVGSRKLEGLDLAEPQICTNPLNLQTDRVWVKMRPASSKAVNLCVDLTGGQKTGLFLDQQFNTMLACQFLHPTGTPPQPLVLDLFSHVGQWGAQLGLHLQALGKDPKVHVVDASAKALELASLALGKAGLRHEALKADIIAEAKSLYAGKVFDAVICDPPALIKNKKDLGAGSAAYRKVNEASMRLVKPGGLFISSSCSHHFDKQAFWAMLGEASQRADTGIDWLHIAGQSPDHPVSPLFPQGAYLKCAIGRRR